MQIKVKKIIIIIIIIIVVELTPRYENRATKEATRGTTERRQREHQQTAAHRDTPSLRLRNTILAYALAVTHVLVADRRVPHTGATSRRGQSAPSKAHVPSARRGAE